MRLWRMFVVIGLAFMIASCVAPGGRLDRRGDQGWELLGQQEALFNVDKDRINVGRREGRFSAIRIEVRGAPVEMRDIIVTFDDGSKFTPNLRTRFEENSRSHVIDLPGGRRVIRWVEFTYRSIDRREGKATVMLYAR